MLPAARSLAHPPWQTLLRIYSQTITEGHSGHSVSGAAGDLPSLSSSCPRRPVFQLHVGAPVEIRGRRESKVRALRALGLPCEVARSWSVWN